MAQKQAQGAAPSAAAASGPSRGATAPAPLAAPALPQDYLDYQLERQNSKFGYRESRTYHDDYGPWGWASGSAATHANAEDVYQEALYHQQYEAGQYVPGAWDPLVNSLGKYLSDYAAYEADRKRPVQAKKQPPAEDRATAIGGSERRGRLQTILTGGLGLGDQAQTRAKTLLGG